MYFEAELLRSYMHIISVSSSVTAILIIMVCSNLSLVIRLVLESVLFDAIIVTPAIVLFCFLVRRSVVLEVQYLKMDLLELKSMCFFTPAIFFLIFFISYGLLVRVGRVEVESGGDKCFRFSFPSTCVSRLRNWGRASLVYPQTQTFAAKPGLVLLFIF